MFESIKGKSVQCLTGLRIWPVPIRKTRKPHNSWHGERSTQKELVPKC